MITNQLLNRLTHTMAGLSRRMHQALLLPAMLVLLVSACSPAATAPANLPANATTAPVVSAATATQPPAAKSVLPDDPRLAVENALRAQVKALPFKVTMTIGSGDKQMNTTIVIETPTRILVDTGSRSVISADGKCYEKTGDAAWVACASATTGQIAQTNASSLLDEATINQAISIIKTVKLDGSETLDGINTNVYEYTSSGQLMGVQVDSTTKLWVDVKTGLPIKSVGDSTAGGASASYTQLISYDPTIKVPTP